MRQKKVNTWFLISLVVTSTNLIAFPEQQEDDLDPYGPSCEYMEMCISHRYETWELENMNPVGQ